MSLATFLNSHDELEPKKIVLIFPNTIKDWNALPQHAINIEDTNNSERLTSGKMKITYTSLP